MWITNDKQACPGSVRLGVKDMILLIHDIGEKSLAYCRKKQSTTDGQQACSGSVHLGVDDMTVWIHDICDKSVHHKWQARGQDGLHLEGVTGYTFHGIGPTRNHLGDRLACHLA